MNKEQAEVQLKKDVDFVISKMAKSYQYKNEIEFHTCTFDEVQGLAFHFKKESSNVLHLVPLALGCKSKSFGKTKVICWKWKDGEYTRTTHLPGECI